MLRRNETPRGDAALALLLNELSQQEGRRLLEENERLRGDPDLQPPREVYEAGRRAIEREFARRRQRRRTRKALRSALLAAALAATLFTAAYAAIPQVRMWTQNLILEQKDEALSMTFITAPEVPPGDTTFDTLMGYRIPSTPSGFEIISCTEGTSTGEIIYRSGTGQVIWVSIYRTVSMNVDTESTDEIDLLEINGRSGVLIKKGGSLHLALADEDTGCFIDIVGQGIDESFLTVMAEQLLQ